MNKEKISPPIPFEEAFGRLEKILAQMNSGELSLDDSLTLYEEADRLIAQSSQRLTEAEKRIEMLIKSREGELVTDGEGQPQTELFGMPSDS